VRRIAVIAVLLLVSLPGSAKEGDELLGTAAPEWRGVVWARGGPYTLAGLHGKVVLVRWWTVGCSMCLASAPALDELQQKYGSKGLVVVGMFHPKPPRAVTAKEVRDWADRVGIRCPVAIDADWALLRRYWLDGHDRAFTSVSFLIDQQGRIRYVHPGGEFHGPPDPPYPAPDGDRQHHACHQAYREMEALIGEMLKGGK